jgi:hypothetical protein
MKKVSRVPKGTRVTKVEGLVDFRLRCFSLLHQLTPNYSHFFKLRQPTLDTLDTPNFRHFFKLRQLTILSQLPDQGGTLDILGTPNFRHFLIIKII